MTIRRKPRCLSEQAYVYAFDIIDDSESRERYIRSHQMYFKAMETAGDHVDLKEREDWELGDAIGCRKIYRSKGNYIIYLETSLQRFH